MLLLQTKIETSFLSAQTEHRFVYEQITVDKLIVTQQVGAFPRPASVVVLFDVIDPLRASFGAPEHDDVIVPS
jgi:hypothetical protein